MIDRLTFDGLVGAYALDACEPDEVAAMDAYVAAHPDAEREVERLREAAVWLAANEASTPPLAMRSGLVALARSRRSTDAAAPLDVYRRERSRLADALAAGVIDPDAVTANGLTVRELVIHLAAAERTVAAEILEPSLTTWDDAIMHDITARELAACADLSYAGAVARWSDATDQVIELAGHADHAIAGQRLSDVLLIRAFETWTHHDDILAVHDEPETVPEPRVLQSLVEFSVRSTPWALAMRGATRSGATARLRLRGAVTGEWELALATDTPDPADPAARASGPIATITIDALDWCKRFADRRDADVAHSAGGDLDVVRDVIAAAPVFAGL